MKGWHYLRAVAAAGSGLALTACPGPIVSTEIPHCERYVPASMRAPVEGVDIPQARTHADGHQDAEPWIDGYLGQTGQLDKANDRAAGVDHIYSTCLDQHRDELKRATRGFFGRLFG